MIYLEMSLREARLVADAITDEIDRLQDAIAEQRRGTNAYDALAADMARYDALAAQLDELMDDEEESLRFRFWAGEI